MDNIQKLIDAFFVDCETGSREPSEENLRAWLWFVCPAHMRAEVEPAIRADARIISARTKTIRLRVTDSEHRRIKLAADEFGQTVSQYIRDRIFY